MNKNDPNKQLDWANILFLTLSPIAALVGGILYTQKYGVTWQELTLFTVMYFATGMSITGGYHRLFSHVSYVAHPFVKMFYLIFGACAMQNSVLHWSADHRVHHRFTDTDLDPYNAGRGFWWSHMGWIICKRYEKTEYSMIKDFTIYPEIMWLNKYHLVVSVLYATFCFAVGALAGRLFPEAGISGLQFLIWGYFLSTVFVYHGTFTINSLSHVWGWKRFDVSDESRNNPVLALITMGEGWHNNHHRFPNSARQGLKWWEYDISHGILKVLSWVGFVHSLKKPSAVDVLTAKRAA
jgi:stearoyl-CoA desaturase (delta-9 desaturase)